MRMDSNGGEGETDCIVRASLVERCRWLPPTGTSLVRVVVHCCVACGWSPAQTGERKHGLPRGSWLCMFTFQGYFSPHWN
jgi:hypothetical protein